MEIVTVKYIFLSWTCLSSVFPPETEKEQITMPWLCPYHSYKHICVFVSKIIPHNIMRWVATKHLYFSTKEENLGNDWICLVREKACFCPYVFFGFLTVRILLTNQMIEWLLLVENGNSVLWKGMVRITLKKFYFPGLGENTLRELLNKITEPLTSFWGTLLK